MASTRPCRLFLFDLDGTLVDSSEDIARAVNALLTRMERPTLSKSVVLQFVGDGMESLVERILRQAIGTAPCREKIKAGTDLLLEEYGKHLIESSRLYPGVRETLAALRTARVGLVSNKPEALSRRVLAGFGLAERFCVVLGGDSLARRKPHPDQILSALERCQASPRETVMVGDSPTDIHAGKAAGVLTCGLSCGFRGREELEAAGCDVIIDHFARLLHHFSPPPAHP